MSSPERPSPPRTVVTFGPFLLDRPAGRLWRERDAIELRPKAWEVLCYLVDRPGVLVSSDELFDRVWRGVAVTPQTLMNVIAQLRTALGDDARAPRWLETVRGRGYRFSGDDGAAVVAGEASSLARGLEAAERASAPPLVGRERELDLLAAAWRRACGGDRQTLFVVGEAGIGKTTLVEAFARSLEQPRAAATGDGERSDPPMPAALVARGHCVGQHGTNEPYLPILSAIEVLADGPLREQILSLLARNAPTWLVQLPALVEPRERAELERAVRGTTGARMLREGVGLVEAVAKETPTLLVLEDLHWSDASTLDLLGLLGKRTRPARLLLLCTFRPSTTPPEHSIDAIAARLRATGDATVANLPPLDPESIAAYLELRLADPARAARLAPDVEARSAGNPLFLRSLVDEIVDEDWSSASSLDSREVPGAAATAEAQATPRDALATPRALQDVIERHLGALPASIRTLLEVASVAGVDFSAVELARALAREPASVDADLHGLARAGRLVVRRTRSASGDEPVGYGFVHAAYRLAVHDRIAPLERNRIHGDIARTLEANAGPRLPLTAARLARHFRAAGDIEKAITYLRLAGETAAGRFAHREAVACLEEALELIRASAPSPDLRTAETQVQIQLGSVIALDEGYSSERAGRAFARAGTLLEDGRPLFAEKLGIELLLTFGEITAARWREAHERATRLLASVEGIPPLLPVACCWLAYPTSAIGDLDAARQLLERGAAADPFPGVPPHFDIHRMIDSQLALVRIALGDLAGGAKLRDAALARSRAHGSQLDLAHAALWATEAAVLADDREAGREIATFSVAVSERNGFPRYLVQSRLYAAWLDATLDPPRRVAIMEQMLSERRAFGDRFQETIALGLISQAKRAADDQVGADAALDEALARAEATGERHFEAELLRLDGERHRARATARGSRSGTADGLRAAESSFRRALDLATRQRSRRWGRRVLASLEALLGADPSRVAARAELPQLSEMLESDTGD